ncbi:hypothetical protein PCE1_003859 [Barthelona sp. PCE]
MSEGRDPTILATKMCLKQCKDRLKSAKHGHSLLKKKADALTLRYREVQREIEKAKLELEDAHSTAKERYAEMTFRADSNITHFLEQQVGSASTKVTSKLVHVAGVVLPRFEVQTDSLGTTSELSALQKGGEQIRECKKEYFRMLEYAVRVAALQKSYKILNEVIKQTNRRVNAIENVIIPRLDATIHYIKGEIDEMAREDFFRLKKVQKAAKIRQEKEHEERRLREEKRLAEEKLRLENMEDVESSNEDQEITTDEDESDFDDMIIV